MSEQRIIEPLIEGEQTYEKINEQISGIVSKQTGHPRAWFAAFLISFLFVNVLLVSVTYLIYQGIGIWGNNIPVGWGFDIINFVWWIGIGHAGTLISAILLLMRQEWRTSINRFAEAMTIFAVMCAGMYPVLHTGRPWVAYWLFPYPSILGLWPQFRSPLIWDVFAVSTYMTVSILYWYTGLVPDLATLRDRLVFKPARILCGMLALGWRGASRHWARYEAAYLIMAGLSTPLVLSVHSIVSLDFAVALLPGWHTTIFPPYFVAGAVYAGFAMVLTFMVPLRKMYHIENLITMRHIDWMCKIMLTTGLIVFYGYIMEMFYAWYSANPFEQYMMHNRWFGPYAPLYWLLLFCNGVAPQILWSRKYRYHLPTVFAMSLIVGLGMWLERFIIIPVSLHRDFLPSSWGMYYPTLWDFGVFLGTIGFFVMNMFLFVRFVPMISIFEVRELWHRLRHRKRPEPEPAAAGVEEK